MLKINKIFIKIIIILIIFHSLYVAGIWYNFRSHDTFLNSVGVDDDDYFSVSLAIMEGNPISTIRNIGLPLFFIPFIYIFKATNVNQILFPLSFFNSLILYNISIILLAIIALRLTGKIKASLFAAALWTIFPWLVYLLVKVKPGYDYPGLTLNRLTRQMFMHIASDAASTFFVLLTVYLGLVFSNKNKKSLWSIILGLCLGISILIRIQNIALLAVVLSIYIYRKEFKNLLVFMISALFILIPQFIYNWIALHSFLNLKTIIGFETIDALGTGCTSAPYSIRSIPYILRYISGEYPLYALVITAIIILISIVVFIDLYHKEKLSFYILSSWIVSYIIIYGLYYGTATDLLRYAMPIIPAMLILITIGIFRIVGARLKWV